MTNNVSNCLLGLLAPIYQDGGESVSRNKKKGALSRIKDGITAVLSKIKSGVKSMASKIQIPFHRGNRIEQKIVVALSTILVHSVNWLCSSIAKEKISNNTVANKGSSFGKAITSHNTQHNLTDLEKLIAEIRQQEIKKLKRLLLMYMCLHTRNQKQKDERLVAIREKEMEMISTIILMSMCINTKKTRLLEERQ